MLAMILCLVFSIVFLFVFAHFVADDWTIPFGALGILFGASFLAMAIIAVCVNVGAKGKLAAKQETYASLVYQLENNLYDNDNDIGKRELYEEITKWNADVARGKAMQHDLWVGVFYPDIYDVLDVIEFEGK